MKTMRYLIFMMILFMIASCNNHEEKKNKAANLKNYKESLIKANKELNKTEEDDIENYIARYNWNMQKTGRGLRYMIYKHGNGSKPKDEQSVKINFSVNLINGFVCYSSEKDGQKEFEIGKGSVESGLEEGIFMMRVGDKAKFVIPSYLAFGLLGDQNKIPKRATLIYDVELLDVR